MAGEVLHARGAEGVRRAKLWLDRTTRAEARWLVPDTIAVNKLTFKWHDGSTYSFDLGGLLRFGGHDQEIFVAECKFYSGHHAQGTMFTEFIAKCYRARLIDPARADQFIWITWAPFLVTKWEHLAKPSYIREAIHKHGLKCVGKGDTAGIDAEIDDDLIKDLAERLHVIVLHERQEEFFVMSKEHLAIINKHETERGD